MGPQPISAKERQAQRQFSLSRRSFLRGLGTCVALPTMASLQTAAQGAPQKSGERAPVRMAYFLIPNGAVPEFWFPEGSGKDFKLGQTMQPLVGFEKQMQIFRGLDQLNADPGLDGGGDHARAGATYLTGLRAKKTGGKDIECGISVDQVGAQALGHLTRFASLELTCDVIRNSGACDTGYACAYQYNMAWSSPTTPITPESNPRLAFERLFGTGAHGERRKSFEMRQEKQKSVLDFVMADAKALNLSLDHHDRLKLDEYLTGVREIENRIKTTELNSIPDPEMGTPAGIPEEIGDRWDIMYDIMALAFQSDQTRISTLLLAYDGSNLTYPQLGIREGHHWLTHNMRVPELRVKVGQIEHYYMQHFARFVNKLASIEDSDGHSLLDNCMLMYGGAISDGNRHKHNNCPALLVGGGGGKLNTGRYVDAGAVPMSNMFIGMLDRFGVPDVKQFGDSTGRFDDI